eukprot:s73_g33.t1
MKATFLVRPVRAPLRLCNALQTSTLFSCETCTCPAAPLQRPADFNPVGCGFTPVDAVLQGKGPVDRIPFLFYQPPCIPPQCAEGCLNSSIADDSCQPACNNSACDWDGGDCDLCAPGCQKVFITDLFCQPACNNSACDWDGGKCDLCAEGCQQFFVANGFCDAPCNNSACDWDGGDCDLCAPGCQKVFITDGFCLPACNNSACDWDGGDCDECAPGCLNYFIANDWCQPACNNSACDWDGGDCVFAQKELVSSGGSVRQKLMDRAAPQVDLELKKVVHQALADEGVRKAIKSARAEGYSGASLKAEMDALGSAVGLGPRQRAGWVYDRVHSALADRDVQKGLEKWVAEGYSEEAEEDVRRLVLKKTITPQQRMWGSPILGHPPVRPSAAGKIAILPAPLRTVPHEMRVDVQKLRWKIDYNVVEIEGNGYAFAARLVDGSVVTWGEHKVAVETVLAFGISFAVCRKFTARIRLLLLCCQMDPWLPGAINVPVVIALLFNSSSKTCSGYMPTGLPSRPFCRTAASSPGVTRNLAAIAVLCASAFPSPSVRTMATPIGGPTAVRTAIASCSRCIGATAMEVWSATSGEILLLLLAEEVTGRLVKDVRDLLSPHLGVPRFRQRLFDANLAIMEDSMRFDIVPEKIQVVAVAFNPCPTHQGIDTLVHAVQNNDLATVEAMLTAAVDPNAAADNRFETPLQMAVVRKGTTIVQLLLEAYADINAKSKCCWETTALAKVAESGDMDMVRFLVERGACVNASSALAYAASEGHPDVARYLLEAGADKDCQRHHFATPLVQAVLESDYTIVAILLEGAADVNASNGFFETPLMIATCSDLPMSKKNRTCL